MCLTIYKAQPRVAEEDIVCYKFVRVLADESLVSPYQKFKYELGKEYTAELGVTIDTTSLGIGVGIVEEGLHTIARIEDAKQYARLRVESYCGYHTYAVVECIIPKGATYYEGTWSGREGYVSNRLTAIKIVSKYYYERKAEYVL